MGEKIPDHLTEVEAGELKHGDRVQMFGDIARVHMVIEEIDAPAYVNLILVPETGGDGTIVDITFGRDTKVYRVTPEYTGSGE